MTFVTSWLWDFAEINRTPCRRGWTINRNDLDEMMGTSSKYLGVLGRASGFILEWSGSFFFRGDLLPCTSLCHPSRSIQSIAFNNPPWKLKIDTKTCDLEKAALYVHHMSIVSLFIHVKLSFVQESAWHSVLRFHPLPQDWLRLRQEDAGGHRVGAIGGGMCLIEVSKIMTSTVRCRTSCYIVVNEIFYPSKPHFNARCSRVCPGVSPYIQQAGGPLL